MKISLKNIGKVSSASVEINGITVIAGANDTGKSTVGKTLFAVFNSFYNIKNNILTERINSVSNQIALIYNKLFDDFESDYDEFNIAKKIIYKAENMNSGNLTQTIIDTIAHYDERIASMIEDKEFNDIINRIVILLTIPSDTIFDSVFQKKIDAEFNGQISNVYSNNDSSICLTIRNEPINIRITDNKVRDISKRITLNTEAIYIDDPFVLDELSLRIFRQYRYSDHKTHLKEKLFFTKQNPNVVEEIVTSSKFEQIYDKVSSVCVGNVIQGKRYNWGYQIAGSDKMLEIKNLSTGLKTFAILKKLLLNGHIESNGTVILDEPEIHLHPEWQLKFAELIVLLHAEFGLHILLNTHSPYFLNAIEVYSFKYGVNNKCKYYLAQNTGNVSNVTDVTNNLEIIYSKLARPLQDLENERYRYD